MITIPLMRNTFLNESDTRNALVEFIKKSDKLSMDVECGKFEKQFAAKQGRKFAILFNSGGSANLALLQAMLNLGLLKKESNVGFSAVTWSTNTMPIIQLGMNAIPVDCELDTLNVSSETLLKRLEEVSMDALFLTNVLGFVSDIEKIKEICNQKKIHLIEDNCESLGTHVVSGKAGNFGLASTFSFFVAHHMSTIEGGMICTDDAELAIMLKIVRANGWDRNLNEDEKEFLRKKFDIKDDFTAKYTFYDLGYNFRPTEITGFLGQYQLQFLDENIDKRESNYLRLEPVIKANPDFLPLRRDHITKLSTFAIPIVCKDSATRDYYVSKFMNSGVEVRPMIAGNIQKQPFFQKYSKALYSLPNADFMHTSGFYFGNYPELVESDLLIFERLLKNL